MRSLGQSWEVDWVKDSFCGGDRKGACRHPPYSSTALSRVVLGGIGRARPASAASFRGRKSHHSASEGGLQVTSFRPEAPQQAARAETTDKLASQLVRSAPRTLHSRPWKRNSAARLVVPWTRSIFFRETAKPPFRCGGESHGESRRAPGTRPKSGGVEGGRPRCGQLHLRRVARSIREVGCDRAGVRFAEGRAREKPPRDGPLDLSPYGVPPSRLMAPPDGFAVRADRTD